MSIRKIELTYSPTNLKEALLRDAALTPKQRKARSTPLRTAEDFDMQLGQVARIGKPGQAAMRRLREAYHVEVTVTDKFTAYE